MARTLAGLAVALAIMAWGGHALADSTARLLLVRDPDAAAACPDETALRRAVEARTGRDPFSIWGSDTIVVRFDHDAAGFVTRVELVTAGDSRGARSLRSDGPTCAGLVDAAALAVSIALDSMKPAEVATPQPESSSEVQSEQPAHSLSAEVSAGAAPADPSNPSEDGGGSARESAPSPPASPRRVAPVIGLDFLASAGSAPSVSPGLSVWGRLGLGRLSLGLEIRGDLPNSGVGADGGAVSVWLVAGGLAPCVQLAVFFGCAVGELGVVHGGGENIAVPNSGARTFAAIGPRIGIELPLSQRFALRFRADVLANPAPAAVILNGATAWSASVVEGTLAAGVAVWIP